MQIRTTKKVRAKKITNTEKRVAVFSMSFLVLPDITRKDATLIKKKKNSFEKKRMASNKEELLGNEHIYFHNEQWKEMRSKKGHHEMTIEV